MPGRCAIIQPNYIPWKGYFSIIQSVDHFVFYDVAQYTKGDWRNRNILKTSDGPCWLTIPVPKKSHHLSIAEVKATNDSWKNKHLASWKIHYARAPHAEEFLPLIGDWYETCPGRSLVEICAHFVKRINAALGIETPLHFSSDFTLPNGRNEKLIALCREFGCDEYVSGQAAKAYLDEAAFREAGISVAWFDYRGYPEYPQPYPPFRHEVSVLDLLLCTGSRACSHMQPERPPPRKQLE